MLPVYSGYLAKSGKVQLGIIKTSSYITQPFAEQIVYHVTVIFSQIFSFIKCFFSASTGRRVY